MKRQVGGILLTASRWRESVRLAFYGRSRALTPEQARHLGWLLIDAADEAGNETTISREIVAERGNP